MFRFVAALKLGRLASVSLSLRPPRAMSEDGLGGVGALGEVAGTLLRQLEMRPEGNGGFALFDFLLSSFCGQIPWEYHHSQHTLPPPSRYASSPPVAPLLSLLPVLNSLPWPAISFADHYVSVTHPISPHSQNSPQTWTLTGTCISIGSDLILSPPSSASSRSESAISPLGPQSSGLDCPPLLMLRASSTLISSRSVIYLIIFFPS